MRAAEVYDYAVVRVVPRVEREEFINAGVILSCQKSGFLQAAMALDEARLLALDPDADIDIARLPYRARFHWLTARRSAIIQTSPVHTGRCTDAAAALEHVMDRMVRPWPTPHR